MIHQHANISILTDSLTLLEQSKLFGVEVYVLLFILFLAHLSQRLRISYCYLIFFSQFLLSVNQLFKQLFFQIPGPNICQILCGSSLGCVNKRLLKWSHSIDQRCPPCPNKKQEGFETES